MTTPHPPLPDQPTPLAAEPIRDWRYHKTLWQDLAWHKIRRWRHQLGCWQEQRQPWLSTPIDKGDLKLSVCIITMNAADRIEPLIRHCKTFADEIVIGVDSKTTDDTFSRCQAAGADVVFTIQNEAQTCNAGLEMLVARCSGDWILRLDDDEYVEPQLQAWFGNLMHQTRYTHFKIPRLHLCHIDPLEWVNDSYLYPDYQMRFFKNDKNLMHFPGAVGHTSITCNGKKGRLFGGNIVHLNLAINSRQKRQAKLEKYIRRHQGGWVHPINEYALLFEEFNYNIEPYNHPDATFCDLLASVVRDVRHQERQERQEQQERQPLAKHATTTTPEPTTV